MSARCQPVRRAALEIDDEATRAHLEEACDLLTNSDVIQQFGSRHTAQLAWAVQHTSEALISIYLRGVTLPDPLPERTAKALKILEQSYSAELDFWATFESEEDEGGGD